MTPTISRVCLAAAVMCFTAVGAPAYQSTTRMTETKAFEVLAVDGNTFDRQVAGRHKELTVPDDFRFNVNGQQLSVHELKVRLRARQRLRRERQLPPSP